MPAISTFSLLPNNTAIRGSGVGSPDDIRQMMNLAVAKGLKPWVETRKMGEANEALIDMAKGLARYRYVLVNENDL